MNGHRAKPTIRGVVPTDLVRLTILVFLSGFSRVTESTGDVEILNRCIDYIVRLNVLISVSIFYINQKRNKKAQLAVKIGRAHV